MKRKGELVARNRGIGKNRYKAIFNIGLILLVIVFAYSFSKYSGILIAPSWEHVDAITVDSGVTDVNYTVVFDKYKTADCKENIYVTDGEDPVSFDVVEHTTDPNGMCDTAIITFKNVPSSQQTQTVVSTPTNESSLPKQITGVVEKVEGQKTNDTKTETITGAKITGQVIDGEPISVPSTELTYQTYYVFYGRVQETTPIEAGTNGTVNQVVQEAVKETTEKDKGLISETLEKLPFTQNGTILGILDVPDNPSSISISSTYGFNTTSEDITAYARSRDVDGDNITLMYAWYENGAPFYRLLMPLDNQTGATDYSGNGNIGTVTGATWIPYGKVAGAYSFSAGNHYITIANESQFDFERTNNFTIATWLYGSPALAWHSVITKQLCGSPYQGYELAMSSTGYYYFQIGDTGGATISRTTSSALNGAWHYIVVTYNGSSTYQGIKIYIDGNEDTSASGSGGPLTNTILNNNAMGLGARMDGTYCKGSANYRGYMDDVRITPALLTANQVQKMYNETKGYFNSTRGSPYNDTIMGSMLTVGNNWSATVTANDKTGDSGAVSSSNLTVKSGAIIDACNILNTPNGVYSLAKHISGNLTGGKCLDVQANNITIDCQGFNITGIYGGTATRGIYLGGYNNTTIKNCKISGYDRGIYVYSNVNNDTIKNNNITANTYGVYLESSYSNLLVNNTINSNGYGVRLQGEQSDNVTNNTLNSNTNYGIYLAGSSNNNLINNTVNNDANGIEIDGAGSNNITNNLINNSGIGLTLALGSYSNIVSGNNISSNGNYGIYFFSSRLNSLVNNNLTNNGWDFFSENSPDTGTYLSSEYNTFVNLTLNDSTVSFTYNGSIYIKDTNGVGRNNPQGYSNISSYFNITNATVNAWVFLNVSYKDTDIPSSLDTSTLRIWKNSSGQWFNAFTIPSVVGPSGQAGVNLTAKYVYANITNFSSIYAPMGSTTSLSNCNDISQANTVYTLSSNLVGNQSDGICIDIQANNVTLNCAGFNITKSYLGTTTGIRIQSYNNTTIKNCNFYSYTYGVYINLSVNNTFDNNTFTSNFDGIYSYSSSNNTLTNNTANSNNVGFYFESSSNNTFTNNTINSHGASGLFLYSGSNYNRVFRNVMNINSGPGIRLYSSNYNNVTNNTANSNSHGISIELSANYNIISKNNVSLNINGIYLSSSSNNSIVDNNASSNTGDGVECTSSESNNISNNLANFNTVSGINLYSSANNTVTNNTALSNTNGIIVQNYANNNIISKNTVSSDFYGIYVDTCNNVTVTSNNASFNTNGFLIASLKNLSLVNNTANSNTGDGIELFWTQNITVGNNTVNSNLNRGFWLTTSVNTSNFTNNSAWNNVKWDFFSEDNSIGNIVINLTTNNTTSSFTYFGDIYIRGSNGAASPNPVGYSNISHYLNITNATSGAWISLNISYIDADIPAGVNPAYTRIWKNSSGQWFNAFVTPSVVGPSGQAGINTAGKYVYANITNFSSIYAPIANTQCRAINSAGSYSLTGDAYGYFTFETGSGGQAAACIVINTSNVIFDCSGHSINGDLAGSAAGIFLRRQGVSNITVVNCTVYNYSYGLVSMQVNNSLFRNNVFMNSTELFQLTNYGAHNMTIINNTFLNGFDDGLVLTGSNGWLRNITVYNNTFNNASRNQDSYTPFYAWYINNSNISRNFFIGAEYVNPYEAAGRVVIQYAENVTIEDNVFNKTYLFADSHISSSKGNITINRNIFTGHNIEDAFILNNSIIKNNYFNHLGPTFATRPHYIYLSGDDSANVLFMNNTFVNTRIYAYMPGSLANSNITIFNNSFYQTVVWGGTYNDLGAIELDYIGGANISNNNMFNLSQNGIYAHSNAANLSVKNLFINFSTAASGRYGILADNALVNATFSNISMSQLQAVNTNYGIHLIRGSNFTLNNITLTNLSLGIWSDEIDNSSISNVVIINASNMALRTDGSWLSPYWYGRSSNFTNITVLNSFRCLYLDYNNKTDFNNSLNDFYCDGENISMKWGLDTLTIYNHSGPMPSDPPRYGNITHYLNVSSLSVDSWYTLNWTYAHADIPPNIQLESTLSIWKNNYSSASPVWSKTKILQDAAYPSANRVFANVTGQEDYNAYLAILGDTSGCRIINSPGVYTTTGDLSGNITYNFGGCQIPGETYPCVAINSSDVVLDCAGHKIVGTTTAYEGAGVLLSSYITGGSYTQLKNITIKNCNISNYKYGIGSTGTNSSYFLNNIITDDSWAYRDFPITGDTGCFTSSNLTFINDTFRRAGNGLYTVSTVSLGGNPNDNITVYNNTFDQVVDSALGMSSLYLYSYDRVNVSNNFLNSSTPASDDTVAIYDARQYVNFVNNMMYNGTVDVHNSLNVTVANNSFSEKWYLFSLDGCNNTLVNNNTFNTTSTQYPTSYFRLYNKINNLTISSNYFHKGTIDDINVNAFNVTVFNNTFNNTPGDAAPIYFVNAFYLLNITKNRFYNMSGAAVYIGSSVTAASGNMLMNLNFIEASSTAGYNAYGLRCDSCAAVNFTISNNNITSPVVRTAGVGLDLYGVVGAKNITAFNNSIYGYYEGIRTSYNNSYFYNNRLYNINPNAVAGFYGLHMFAQNTGGNKYGYNVLFTNLSMNNSTCMYIDHNVLDYSNITFINITCNSENFDILNHSGTFSIRKNVTSPLGDAAGYKNISHYLNVSSLSPNSWLTLNWSYKDADLVGRVRDDNTLSMWRHQNNTTYDRWVQSGINTPSVDSINNYVYSNVSNFTYQGVTFDQTILTLFGIVDAPPVMNTLVMNSTSGNNYTSDNLTCYASSSDPNGDSTSNIFNWILNGQPYADLILSFDNNSATVAKDYSGYGHDAGVYGPTWISNGKVGGAYTLHGLTMNGGIDTLSSKTIELWVKTDINSMSDDETVFYIGCDNSGGAEIRITLDGVAAFTEWTSYNTVYSGYVADDTWHHLAFTVGPTGMNAYTDGVLSISNSANIAPDSGSCYYAIGESPAWTNYKGSIDEVRVYGNELSAQQIKQRYLDTKDGFTNNSSIVSQELAPGQNWSCNATPINANSDGTTNSSNNLTVRNAAQVSDCMNLTYPNAVYTLRNNIPAPGVQSGRYMCFDVQADNITLDFNGYNLTTDTYGYTGIEMNANNFTLKNFKINNYTNGISGNGHDYIKVFNGSFASTISIEDMAIYYLYSNFNVSNVNITGMGAMTIYANPESGIIDRVIVANPVADTYFGIYNDYNTQNMNITNCNFTNVTYAFYGAGDVGDHVQILNNNITTFSYGQSAVHLGSATGAITDINISGNRITDTNSLEDSNCLRISTDSANINNNIFQGCNNGVYIIGASNAIIERNIMNNTQVGIYLDSSNGDFVRYNTILNSVARTADACGITSITGSNMMIANNFINNSAYFGIEIFGDSTHGNMSNVNNTINYNQGDAFYISDVSNSTFVNNTVDRVYRPFTLLMSVNTLHANITVNNMTVTNAQYGYSVDRALVELNNSNIDATQVRVVSGGNIVSNFNDKTDENNYYIFATDLNKSDILNYDFGVNDNVTVYNGTIRIDENADMNKLNVNSIGNFNATNYYVNVTTDATIDGAFRGGTVDNKFARLTVNSGGVYNATSGTSTITNSPNGATCITLDSASTFVNNGGTFLVNAGGITGLYTNTNGKQFYNFNWTAPGGWNYYTSALNMSNNFYLGPGVSLSQSNGGSTVTLTADGVAVLSGTLGRSGFTLNAINNRFGELSITPSGSYYATSGITNVSGDTNNSGTFNALSGTLYLGSGKNIRWGLYNPGIFNGGSGTHNIGSLYQTGTFTATSGIMTVNGCEFIVSGAIANFAGGINANGGTIVFSPICSGYIGGLGGATIQFNNVTINAPGYAPYIIDGNTRRFDFTNLTIQAGTLNNLNGAKINVTNMMNVSGTYLGGTSDERMGKIIINSGGVYNASTGTTFITSSDAAGYNINSTGTFNHKNGRVNITGTGNISMGGVGTGKNFYNLDIYSGASNCIRDNNLRVENILTVYPLSTLTSYLSQYTNLSADNIVVNGNLGTVGLASTYDFGYVNSTNMTINFGGRYNATAPFTNISTLMIINGTYDYKPGAYIVINNTSIAFNIAKNITLGSVPNPPADTGLRMNMSKYVNITNLTTDGGFQATDFNITYPPSNTKGMSERLIQMWRHDGSVWTQTKIQSTSTYTPLHYTWANATGFSIFAPMLTLNTKASIGTIILNSTTGNNVTTDNLTCYVTTSDGNGDPITNIITWALNEVPYATVVMPFDIENNTGAKDYSGNGMNGLLSGGINWSLNGKSGGGYDIDPASTGGYVYIPNQVGLNTGKNVTIESWVKFNNKAANYVTFYSRNSQGPTTGFIWFFTENSAGNNFPMRIQISNGTGYVNAYSSSYTWNYGQWYHIAVTINDGGLISFYRDGSLTNTVGFTGSMLPVTTGNANVQSYAGNLGYSINGSVDEFRLYNRSLSDSQIKQRYLDTVGGFTNNSSIHEAETVKGQVWSCNATPVDTFEDGTMVKSANLTIIDRAPVVSSVVLNSSTGLNLTSDNLTCYSSAMDSDGDAFTTIYNWQVNGKPYANLLYTFDTNNSTNTKDYSGLGNTGTLASGLTWTSAGKIGGAYNFDGSANAYMSGGSGSALDITPNITVTSWIKLATLTQAKYYTVLAKGNEGNSRIFWVVYDNTTSPGKWTLEVGNTTARDVLYSNWAPVPNTWYHIAFTFNSGVGTLYINGTQYASKTYSINSINTTDYPLYIGGYYGNNYNFNGTVDEVKVYNRTLSAAEIKQIYTETSGGVSWNNSTIVSQELTKSQNWTCNATANDAVLDSSIFTSNNLTILNSALTVTNVAVTLNALLACQNITRYCTATVTDADGWADISNATMEYYDKDLVTTGCTANSTKCYRNDSCVWVAGSCSGTSCTANCSITPLRYYAINSSNWICNITANDSFNAKGWNNTTSTVSSLIALDVPDTLDFGAVNPNAYSNNITHTVIDCGNQKIDLQLNGTNMNCPIGPIGVSNISYSTVVNSGYVLLTSTVTPLDFNLLSAVSDAQSTKDTFWRIFVPFGSGGACSGVVTFISILG